MSRMKIDTVLYNGNIHSMDARRPRAQAIAIRRGRILATGMDQDLRERIRAGVKSINLEGRTVIPGLCDAHLHFVSAALAMQRVDLNNLSSLEEALARVAERAARTPKGQWIVGRGWDWTEWRENREPTGRDLDRVAPDHPVALSRTDGHSFWVNSLALQLASLTREVADPEGGKIDRDETGVPTGILREGPAMQFVGRIIPRPTRQDILTAAKEGIPY